MIGGDHSHRRGETPGGVRPGALSALLEELAAAPATEAPEAGLEAGAVVGRFELVREIGRGGFGVVWEARDRELNRRVAFKAVRGGDRPAVREERLLREAEAAARLAHPNIVTLYDVGRFDHGAYLVLELLEGTTLTERIAPGALPVREAVHTAVEIARGLAHAHAHGVVHRDLKPDNVFVCHDGRVKVLDFGLAHAFGRRKVDGGTSGYMAPEQVEGSPEDERTDVWALGAILFELLTGERAFPQGDPTVGAPALDVPGVPDLGQLVTRMLAVRPVERPRDGGEALAALAAIHAGLEASASSGPVRRVRARRVGPALRRLLAAAVAIAGLATAAWAIWWRPPPAPARPAARAIAVLPFANLSATADNEYFSDGLAEEILNLLTRVRELKVAASASSFGFKGRNVEVTDVAQRLRVDVVLVGTVRRERERLRVGAELVDARSGFRMWSQIYDRRLEDVFAIQDDIARQVVGALEIVLSPPSDGELRRGHVPDTAAYDLYLRARAALRLPRTAENLARATSAFDAAIAADARFAPAYAGLCEAWLARYEYGHGDDAFQRADGACRIALEHNPDAGEVYVALGNLHRASGRYESAERELKRALESAPIDALVGLGRTYAAQRRVGDAEAALRNAAAVDPGDWRPHQQLGLLYYANGRYAEAATAYREALARRPDNATAYNNLGAAYYMAGRFEEAAGAWRTAVGIAPTPGTYSNTGSSYFYSGRFDEAAAMYEKALELAPGDHRLWGNLGDARSHSRRREGAAAAYRKAVALAEAALRVNPDDAEARAELAWYEASLGGAKRAAKLVAAAVERDAKSMNVRYRAALVSATAGDADAALAHLDQAVAAGYPRQLLAADPALRALRRDPRFQTLAGPKSR